MGDLNLPFNKTTAGILQTMGVVLVREILTVKGTPALPAKETLLQDRLQKKGSVFQIPLVEKVSQGGSINSFDLLFKGGQALQAFV